MKTNLKGLIVTIGVATMASAQTPAYTTIDYPGATVTQAWGISNRGDVVGLYMLPDKSHHAFLRRGGQLTPIDFPGATSTDTYGINSHGDIVGDYIVGGVYHGFVLSQGRFTTVDVPGEPQTQLAGINNHGEIVGVYVLANNTLHTVLIQGDVIRKYEYPNATSTSGNGINDAGDLVGNFTISGVTKGFVLSNGTLTTIAYPGATFTGAYGITNAGDVAGRYTDSGGVTHGFVYSGGKYTTIDIPGATSTGIDAVNSVGDLVGRYTAGGVIHAFVMNSPASTYTITDLGALDGAPFSQASQGNTDNGLIAGVSAAADGNLHAVLWQYGQTIDLSGTGLGGPNSFAIGLNSKGVVAGEAETSDPDSENFCAFGSGFRCVPFVWADGIMSRLPTLGGNNGAVSAINNRGAMAGLAETAHQDPACPTPQAYQYEAVVWGPGPGQIRALQPLPGDTVGVAMWMNDKGQAVGTSGTCDNTLPGGIIVGPHAVLWDSDGTPIDLGNLGGTVDITRMAVGTRGIYINNVGQVVGGSALEGNETGHAFLWTRDSGIKDLGVLSGDLHSDASAINNRGEIVGVSTDPDFNLRAFVWRNGLMTDLNSLAPADSPLYLMFASGINDRGEIVGWGMTSSGDIHGFLATPNDALAPVQALGVARPSAASNVSRDTVRRLFSRRAVR